MNSSIVVFEFRIINNLFLSYFFSSDIFQHIIKFLNDYNLKWYTNFLEESTTLHSAHIPLKERNQSLPNLLQMYCGHLNYHLNRLTMREIAEQKETNNWLKENTVSNNKTGTKVRRRKIVWRDVLSKTICTQ